MYLILEFYRHDIIFLKYSMLFFFFYFYFLCLIGAILLYLGNSIDILLPEKGKPNVMVLVYLFFITNFLSATQDIVVDGWALTMLKK